MASPIIEIEGIGKRYRIRGQRERYLSLRDELARPFRRLMTKDQKTKDQGRAQDFWALRDISFSVSQGEAVGIIGRNGAGKSTLLKILSQITPPTEGRITMRGRVASLLEVGTGFHPELTGRENVYLNGSILGMTRSEVRRKFDEIVAFAEVEKFLETPVKRYSSGMYVRLAFAVAAHLDPEILLVDEVLAVGDAAFQKKCLGKMGEVAKGGRTVLFVSHNMAAVRQLCNRAILLDSGSIKTSGPVLQCIEAYLGSCHPQGGNIREHGIQRNLDVTVEQITVNGSANDRVDLPGTSRRLVVEVGGILNAPRRLDLEIAISGSDGSVVATCRPGVFAGSTELLPAGRFDITGVVELPQFTKGEYLLSLYLTDPGREGYWDFPNAVSLVAEGTPTAVAGAVLENRLGDGLFVLSGETRYG